MYTPNVGGVLIMLLFSAWSLKLQSLLGTFFCFGVQVLADDRQHDAGGAEVLLRAAVDHRAVADRVRAAT